MLRKRTLYCILCLSLLVAYSCHLKRDNPYDMHGGGQTIYNGVPKLTTTAPIRITYKSVETGGIITDTGGASITTSGIYYSSTAFPTTADSMVPSHSLGRAFTNSIMRLNPNTKYYVRAFATNLYGTGYGNLDSFTTVSGFLPMVTTSPITNIVGATAKSGGVVISDGGLPIIARGVCYRKYIRDTSMPTLSSATFTIDTGTTGSFTSSLNDLYYTDGNYYVRAYATNAQGTAYGDVEVFFPGSQLIIGQTYQGGLIFSIDATGQHGLIAAPYDQTSALVSWGCSGLHIYNVSDPSIMTDSIVSECSELNIAAKICKNLTLGGHNDWFLPSYLQLGQMAYFLAYFGLGNFNTTDSDFSKYWSSSQKTGTNAYFTDFKNFPSNPNPYRDMDKGSGCNVRAIRAF